MPSRERKLNEIADWLTISALTEQPINETIRALAEQLQDCDIPVHRINGATFQRHQIMGAVDTTWDIDLGLSDTEFVPKSVITNADLNNTPAAGIGKIPSNFERYDLKKSETRAKFEVLQNLHARGFRDYLLFKQSYGRYWERTNALSDSEGVYGSLATKSVDGFSESQIDEIRSLWPTFSLFLKTATEQMLSEQLLEAYVGRIPAQNILSGMIERGDGSRVSCVLWYSDLRSSTRLSRTLPSDEYLELLNDFFDCTAGSVIENGGDVLKFIGDGVMAIFPFNEHDENKGFSSALSAARQSLLKADKLRSKRSGHSAANLAFGIGLHVGDVILGNVGTTGRLDMTVIGASANQVTRIEALTKSLASTVLASPQFFQACPDGLTSVGTHPVPDLGGMTEIYGLSETDH
ncbi:MAG: adenylate/guanylate cyclase domain-containing protein [Alphaproteobacteria bacterium]|nr:adenylate/guanylate cyclase domain-containing protein [Alphaproteobacteria bacterium]